MEGAAHLRQQSRQKFQSAEYTYKRLNHENEEIRLMVLMPGEWDDKISCSIFHSPLPKHEIETESKRLSLEDLRRCLPEDWCAWETLSGRYIFGKLGTTGPPSSWNHPISHFDRSLYEVQPKKAPSVYEPLYEALSYTWGPTTKPIVLHIVDQSTTTLEIGANLAIALKNLRYSDSSRILWVDAICINQEDVLERNHEINRMKNIYSLAKRTVIWLGEEADDSAHAISTIEHFAKQVEYCIGGICSDAPGAESLEWWHRDYRLPYDDRTWSCLIALFRRPWFNRVWVLQEALSGSPMSIVQCGKSSLLWTLLRKFILVLERNVTIPHELWSLLASYKPGILPHAMSNLPRLLNWSRKRQCTDPRDKVYGILGLVSPLIAKDIALDYAMPTPEIYRSVLLSDISITKQLNLLQHCRVIGRFDNKPSWIPNWAVDDDLKEIGFQVGGIGRYAAGRSSAQAQYIAPNFLEVTGVYCANVSSVRVSSGSGTPLEILQAVREWEPKGLWTKSYINGGSLLDAFLETILEGHIIDRYPTGYHLPSLIDIRTIYQEASSMNVQKSEANLGMDLKHFETMRFITTQEGYLGVTRVVVETDDRICVLLGSDLPLLLRPTAFGAFIVVGPCFVHGLMDGEALLGPMPSLWRLEVHNSSGPGWANYFVKSSTEKTLDDPRLPPLPSEWEEVGRDHRDYITAGTYFRNTTTSVTTVFDPRMLPKALEAKGIKLKRFQLI